MPPRHGGSPGAIPGSRTNFHAGRAPAVRRSLQNSACWGQHPDGLPTGSWQTSNAPALQAGRCGSVTRRLHHFQCGENEIQARPITSASVGATPTPATNFREVSRLPVCKTGVFKSAGSDDWSVTSASHHSGPVAQPAEQPVVCGKVEGASPFGSANLQQAAASKVAVVCLYNNPAPVLPESAGAISAWCSSNILGLGPRDRRCESCRADHFPKLRVS